MGVTFFEFHLLVHHMTLTWASHVIGRCDLSVENEQTVAGGTAAVGAAAVATAAVLLAVAVIIAQEEGVDGPMLAVK